MASPLLIHDVTIVAAGGMVDGCSVLVESGSIAAIGRREEVLAPPGCEVVDGHGGLLSAGFIDLQVNGGFGRDLNADPASMWELGARLPAFGVTSFLPTIVTGPRETIEVAQEALRSGPPADYLGARPLGLHLEGPFLAPTRRGAHDPAFLQPPDPRMVERWTPDDGVRLVTLAPELPGALTLIRALAGQGVVVAAGHSAADLEAGRAGISAGVRYATHLFNAMPALNHRAPGLVAALLGDDRVTVGVIADGAHVDPAMIDLAWRIAGPERLSLVTDATSGLAMAPGRYPLGSIVAIVDRTTARLTDGTLAGSILSLDSAVRNLVAFTGCSIDAALSTVTRVPATLLGMIGTLGTVSAGATADLVLLGADLRVTVTIVSGELAYRAPSAGSGQGSHGRP